MPKTELMPAHKASFSAQKRIRKGIKPLLDFKVFPGESQYKGKMAGHFLFCMVFETKEEMVRWVRSLGFPASDDMGGMVQGYGTRNVVTKRVTNEVGCIFVNNDPNKGIGHL